MYLRELRRGETEAADDAGDPPGPPAWLDLNHFELGRRFFQENAFSHMLAMFFSLVAGLSVSNLLEPLVFTRQSDQPRKSLLRYLATFHHVTLWHYRDIWAKPHGQAYVSLKTVRRMHSAVRRNMEDVEKRGDDHPRLSQYDMSLVQCGFMGSIIMYPSAFGAQATQMELENYVYFWHVIGFELGIFDANNICRDGFDRAHAVCMEIERDILKPSLVNPPQHFEMMAAALIDGVNLLFKFLPFRLVTVQSVLCFVYEVIGLDRQFWPNMSLGDRVRNLCLRGLINVVYYIPAVRRFFNKRIELILDAPFSSTAPGSSA